MGEVGRETRFGEKKEAGGVRLLCKILLLGSADTWPPERREGFPRVFTETAMKSSHSCDTFTVVSCARETAL